MAHEEKRAAEIERLARQIADLKAKKNSEFSARPARAAATSRVQSPPAPEPVAAEAPMADAVGADAIRSLLGKHGEGSRFCSIGTLEVSEHSSRIAAVAGTVPGVSALALRAAPYFGGDGEDTFGAVAWTYVPAGLSGELVALPPSEVLSRARDIVALRVDPGHIGPTVAGSGAEGRDAMAVVDRSAAARVFDSIKFYAWDIQGQVELGWFKERPDEADATCIGRVVAVFIEEDKNRAQAKSCWGEEDELY
jgi:hypothetical protein